MDNKNVKHVFISYLRDNKVLIDKICDTFKANNIKYWLDRDHIYPGKFWKDSIKEAINNGAYFLVCFSREWEDRTETYMNAELNVAIETLKIKPYNSGWLIPIKLSECEIPAIDIGAYRTLQDIQYLDFHKDWETSTKRLIDMIRREADAKDLAHDEFWEKKLVYQGLKSLIESGKGVGFHNADLGHPVYIAGAMGKFEEMWEYGDSPKKNRLFKILSKLSKDLKELGIEEYRFVWWYDFSEWKDFCKFAVNIYNKRRDINYEY